MLTGWARSWFTAAASSSRNAGSSAAAEAAEHEQQPLAVLSQYFCESIHERAPRFFADELAHDRRVLTAAIGLAEALTLQRRRYARARGDDTRHLLDALASFVLAHEGSTFTASRRRYDMLVDAWNASARRTSMDRAHARPSLVFDDAGDGSSSPSTACVPVIRAWRALLGERLGHVPGVCMVGTVHHSLPPELYDAWTSDAASHVAASTENLFEIEYSVPANDSGGGKCSLHEQAARQGLAPLIDAVMALRKEYGDDGVCLDWTLSVECTTSSHDVVYEHIDTDDEEEEKEEEEEEEGEEEEEQEEEEKKEKEADAHATTVRATAGTMQMHIHCSIAYRAYALATT